MAANLDGVPLTDYNGLGGLFLFFEVVKDFCLSFAILELLEIELPMGPYKDYTSSLDCIDFAPTVLFILLARSLESLNFLARNSKASLSALLLTSFFGEEVSR